MVRRWSDAGRRAQRIARRWYDHALAHRVALATGLAVVVLAAVMFRWLRGPAGFWTIDDAGVTYQASFELADHGSLAAYPEGAPVESYSNPLLFFLVALLRRIHLFDPITTHVRVEMWVFALMVLLVWLVLRTFAARAVALTGTLVFATLELVTPATWIWYGSGLENVWMSTGIVALLWICVRTSRSAPLRPAWGVVPFVVALTRPEAPVDVAVFYVALFAFARPTGVALADHARRIAKLLAVTAVPFAVFLCWRRIGYGAWLPNTYYAKLAGGHHLAQNLHDYVVPQVFPYCQSALFASSVIALLGMPKLETIAPSLVAFLVAAVLFPITAGADWMGEHRFATAFIAVCHLSYATLFAASLARIREQPRIPRALALAVLLVLLVLLGFDRLAVRDKVELNDVTLPRVAYYDGALRWEQQMRAGLPNPVVMTPDAGGSLLVGGMQIVDNAALTDFQMARLDARFIIQYAYRERDPDFVDDNPVWPNDFGYLRSHYVRPNRANIHLLARRDLVVLDRVDPAAQLLFADANLRVFLSPITVRTSAPSSLVRCELIVAWHDVGLDSFSRVRASIAGGDDDELSLEPGVGVSTGIERRALLLGSPDHAGTYPVTIDVVRDKQLVYHGTAFTLEVTSDDGAFERAAAEILRGADAMDVARRVAWLRDQSLPRLGMTQFRIIIDQLRSADTAHDAVAGDDLLALRWTARLSALQSLPPSVRAAELAAATRMVATCPAADTGPHLLCLGRAIDRLRRLGYLGVVSRLPQLAAELDAGRDLIDGLAPPHRYQALVGLTLAAPSDLVLQRRLIDQRAELATAGFPDL